MMALVGNQLKAAGIDAKGFMDEHLLTTELSLGNARMLVMGGGVEDDSRERMKAFCQANGIMVLEHFGGPASLPETIATALDDRDAPTRL